MGETTHTGRVHVALTAGGAAALGASLAITLSAPALTRPVGPAAVFLVALPGSLGLLTTLLLAPLVPRARARVSLGGLIGALPWLAIAAAPMARHPLAAAGAAVAAVTVALAAVDRRPWLTSIPWLLAIALLALRPDARGLSGESSAVVVGFDGATWDQIDVMLEAGELPHFRALREAGATGVLLSDEIMQSPRLWTTIATGVHPETHGIKSFGFDRSRLAAGRAWDEAAARGRSAGLVGWLVNTPPDPTLDFSFPGWITTNRETIPPQASFALELEDALLGKDRRKRWKSFVVPRGASLVLSALAVSSADNVWRFLDGVGRVGFGNPRGGEQYWRTKLLVARLKTDLFLELLARHRPELGALVTYPTDSLAHRFWQYHEPELLPSQRPEDVALHGDVVREAYRTADETLRKVLERIDLEHTTLVVVSDHGMVGVALEERHLLIRGTLLVELLGMEDELDGTRSGRNLVLTPRRAGEAGDAALVRALELLTSAALDDRSGEAFTVVRPEINPGVLVLQLEDQLLPWERRIRIGEQLTTVRDLCYRESFSSDHTRRGILAVAGPGVKRGARVDAVLEDVAPTMLHALGLEIPESLHGRVIREAFDDDWLARNAPRFRPGPMTLPAEVGEVVEDEEVVLERLRELGYVR